MPHSAVFLAAVAWNENISAKNQILFREFTNVLDLYASYDLNDICEVSLYWIYTRLDFIVAYVFHIEVCVTNKKSLDHSYRLSKFCSPLNMLFRQLRLPSFWILHLIQIFWLLVKTVFHAVFLCISMWDRSWISIWRIHISGVRNLLSPWRAADTSLGWTQTRTIPSLHKPIPIRLYKYL